MSNKAATSIRAAVKYPGLCDPPSYNIFLKSLFQCNQPQTLRPVTKAAVDDAWKRLLKDRFPDNDEIGKKLLEVARSSGGQAHWERLRIKYKMPIDPSAASTAIKLKLPVLGSEGKKNGNKRWDAQKYEEFANSVRNRNPGVLLEKESMDEAFRLAVKRVPGSATGEGFERMVSRCLGEESREYWGKERK